MTPDEQPTAQIVAQARREFLAELQGEAVAKEVARLRTQHNKSLWQRLIDKLPFTIQRK